MKEKLDFSSLKNIINKIIFDFQKVTDSQIDQLTIEFTDGSALTIGSHYEDNLWFEFENTQELSQSEYDIG